MDPVIVAALITVAGGIAIRIGIGRRKRQLSETAYIAAQLGYAVQEALSLLDTTDPRIYQPEVATAERSESFRMCLDKIAALCSRLNIQPLGNVRFERHEHIRLNRHFSGIFGAMSPSECSSYRIGVSLGLISLRQIPYFFRYNMLSMSGDAKRFLASAESEYRNLLMLWRSLTGDRVYPEAIREIRKAIHDMRSLEPRNRDISIEEMMDVVKSCDNLSKAVFAVIERRTRRHEVGGTSVL